MEIRNLGRSGLQVSRSVSAATISAAGSTLEERAVVDAALDLGITLFDTADVYGNRGGSETALGRGARRAPQGHRAGDQVRPADGRHGRMAGRLAPLHHAGGRGLAAPAQDRLDRPLPDPPPRPATPIEETLRALDDLVRAGQGPLHRVLEHGRLGRWWTRRGQPRRGPVAVHLRAGRVLAAGPQARGGADAGLRPRLGLLPYFPLAGGLSDRQVHARRRRRGATRGSARTPEHATAT